jgi:phosphatidylglycerophosphate synthase
MKKNNSPLPVIPLRDKIESVPFFHNAMSNIGEKMHPNQITSLRIPLAAGAIGMQALSPLMSAGIAAITDVVDWMDGAVARASNQTTMEGARLDPMVDKIVNTAELVYLVYAMRHQLYTVAGVAFAMGAIENIAVDAYSQLLRGNLLEQCKEGWRATLHPETCAPDGHEHHHLKANYLGKIKKVLQSLAVIIALAYGHNEVAQYSAAVFLHVAVVVGYMGTQKRFEMIEREKEQ